MGERFKMSRSNYSKKVAMELGVTLDELVSDEDIDRYSIKIWNMEF